MSSRKFRNLIEEDSFKVGVERLGGTKGVDEALSPIIEALSIKPEGFDLIPTYGQMRMAKTDRVIRVGYDIPALNVWFYIHDDGSVRLLYVEQREDDEEPPF